MRSAKVEIHKLNYKLSRSRFRWIAWALKPIIRPMLKRIVQKQMELEIAELCHFVNREMVFARERLRATRISRPESMWTFVKAVCTRLGAPRDVDVDISVGMRSSKEEGRAFEGRYAPGSVVKAWEEHGETVGEAVDVAAAGGWRNNVFDKVLR